MCHRDRGKEPGGDQKEKEQTWEAMSITEHMDVYLSQGIEKKEAMKLVEPFVYYFYMGWGAKYALLIGSSTAITYVSGLLLDRADHTKEERAGKLQKKLVLPSLHGGQSGHSGSF